MPSWSIPAGLFGGRRLAAVLLAALAWVPGSQAQTPGGTQIVAQAQVIYRTGAGVTDTAYSGVVTVVVAQVAGLAIEPPRSAVANPGASVVLAHMLRNLGNGADTVAVSAASAAGWPVAVHMDVNGNGALNAVDQPLSGPLALAMGDTAHLLVVVTVPANPSMLGDSVTVAAASQVDPAVSDTVRDLVALRSQDIALELSADRLEVSLGETVSFAAVVENTGTVALADPRVHVRFVAGVRYAPGTVLGADSVQHSGRELTIFLAGPLAPGARATARFATGFVSPQDHVVPTLAWATGDGGGIARSADVVASVRVRRAWPMETRAAIGKVYVDANVNGRQDPGEPGLAGVDVGTDDGEVATTDADGKFSLRNVRPGRHAFRLDATTLPAGYRLPGVSAGEDLVVVDADGWTTPRISFRLVPTTGILDAVLLPAARASALAQGSSVTIGQDAVEYERVPATALPAAELVPAGATIRVALKPAPAGWPEVVYALPDGWELVPGSVRLGAEPASDPTLRRDRSGRPMLAWRFAARQPAAVSFALRPVRAAASEPVRVAPLKSPEDRLADARRALVAPPGVVFVAPADGTVLPSDRLYVGVRGVPGAPVALFDGDSLVAEATLRIDGLHDFVAVALARGPHRLRVRMLNAAQERWDSVAVHVTGLPARFATPAAPIRLTADGQSVADVRVRVLDTWGVPVAVPTQVTVVAAGAEPLGPDTDASSVGSQVRTDSAGWATVSLKPGHQVGGGRVEIVAGEARAELPLELLPALRPLMLTGVGRVGIGASPDAFGAFTARGRVDEQTALVMSYDSRRLDAGRDAFGRVIDPLEETQYPILGDSSRTRTLTASRGVFSARLERGSDWLAVGDVSSGLGTELQLTRYQRSLTGGSMRFTSGRVALQGFGSMTRQDLRQTQLRGTGASGPYILQPDVLPGTEQVVLETRARENAQRTVTRQALVRFVDYEIDYARGTVLFKRPVPAADAYENPVFILVTYEARGVGEQHLVGGLRATVDARQLASHVLDSLRIGGTGIRTEEAGGTQYLYGADVRLLKVGAVDFRAELSRSEAPDSSGQAAMVEGAVHLLDGGLALNAAWMRVGAGYANPSNTALRAGTSEVRLGGALNLGTSTLRVEHERQDFGAGLEREHTRAGIVHGLGKDVHIEAGHTSDRFANGAAGAPDHSQAGELAVRWTPLPALKVWAEARRQLQQSQAVERPDHLGVRGAFQVSPRVTVEAGHRQMILGGVRDYGVTSLGLRSTVGEGTQAWSSYQFMGGAGGAHNAAVIGLNNRLELGSAWRINTSFERRVGLAGLALTDPARSLPFAQVEEDYWAAGLGVEVLPSGEPYRLSFRGDYRDGGLVSTRLATLGAEVPASPSLAVLSRQEYLWTQQPRPTGQVVSRRLASLWGLAFRPVGMDAVNVLTKLTWVEETNPITGGVLTPQGHEQRVIAAAEVIWAPSGMSEVGVRYAVRRTRAERQLEGGLTQNLASWADYLGGRAQLDVNPWLAVRGEARLLVEHESGSQRWDAAPSLVLTPYAAFEVSGGYRAGDLRDPDFAVHGGRGWFLMLGARITEQALSSAADFWRPRFGNNQ